MNVKYLGKTWINNGSENRQGPDFWELLMGKSDVDPS